MSWPIVTLKKVSTKVQYGYTASATYEPIGPKFLRITDIVEPQINWETVPHCVIDELEVDRYKLYAGDIVIARTGNTTGYAKLLRDVKESVFASYLVRVRIDDEIADPGYVGRLVESLEYKRFVNGIKGGAAQGNASAQALVQFRFGLPPLAIQRRIATILSTYDDLIENNRKRIKLMEHAARLLYAEWFVRGRFAGHEGVKVKDGMPEGWGKSSFGDLVSQVKISVKPEEVEAETPYIGLEHIPRRALVLDTWGNAEDVTSNKFAFQVNDILFGKIRPYFHKVGFAITEGITSSDAIVMRPTEDAFGPLALAVASSDHFVAVASKSAKEGSKMPRADWKQMQAYPVHMPSSEVLKQFNDIMRPILSLMKVLAKQNIQLTRARDLLLPRLMSGKVKV